MSRPLRFSVVGILVVAILPFFALCGCKKLGGEERPSAEEGQLPAGSAAQNASEPPSAEAQNSAQDAQPSGEERKPATAEEFDSPHEPLFPNAHLDRDKFELLPGVEAREGAKKYDTTLKIYLPGEYIDLDSVAKFKKQFGVNVSLECFDSNEMMYATLMAGANSDDAQAAKYDLVVASDYMIERLLQLKMLQPLDKALIPNASQLDSAVLNVSYDPGNQYSVPYFWGNVGILYNKKKVDPKDLKAGWSIYRNAKYKGRIFWYDSDRDSFVIALKALGYSINTRNKAEIQKAYEWLVQMNNTMDPDYVTDEVIDYMASGTKDIAIMYSGDAANIIRDYPESNLGFVAPEQGTNVWYDAMVIPSNAEHPKLAHEFINFFVDYEAAKANTEMVGYTSPNGKVIVEMTAVGGEYANNPAYRPRMGYAKDEIFHYNETITEKTATLWAKVKAETVHKDSVADDADDAAKAADDAAKAADDAAMVVGQLKAAIAADAAKAAEDAAKAAAADAAKAADDAAAAAAADAAKAAEAK